MNDDEAFGWIITGIGVVFALVMLLRGYVVWAGSTTAALAAAAVLGIVAVWLLTSWRTRSSGGGATAAPGRTIRLHTHGGHGPRYAAEHEAGHRKVAKAYRAAGVRLGESWIRPDGTGYTDVHIPGDADPNIDIAITAAGRLAAGTAKGCGGSFWPDKGSDNWFIDRAVADGGRKGKGEAMARRALRGGVAADADKLMKDGRVR